MSGIGEIKVVLRALINRFLSQRNEDVDGWQIKTCIAESGVVFHPESRVFNHQTDNPRAIHVQSHTHLRGELLVFAHGGEICIGEYCYIGEGSRVWSARKISIGNRVLIAHLVSVFDSLTHPISAQERHSHFKHIITKGHPSDIDLGEQTVVIKDDAWIGCSSIILRGITIGRGAIVSAGSVVKEDVPDWTIVAGNPAKKIREIPENER